MEYNSFKKGNNLDDYFFSIENRIKNNLEDLTLENFADLWNSEEALKKHIEKRIRKGHIKNAKDYLEKIKDTFLNPDEIYLKKFNDDFKRKNNRLDRIFYKKGKWWVDVFLEDGKIATAFKIEREWEEVLYKGDINTFEIYQIKRRGDGYEIKKNDR